MRLHFQEAAEQCAFPGPVRPEQADEFPSSNFHQFDREDRSTPRRDRQMAKLLLTNAADANAKDKFDWTPKAMAVSRKDWDMVRLLKRHHIPLNPDISQDTCSRGAIQRENQSLCGRPGERSR